MPPPFSILPPARWMTPCDPSRHFNSMLGRCLYAVRISTGALRPQTLNRTPTPFSDNVTVAPGGLEGLLALCQSHSGEGFLSLSQSSPCSPPRWGCLPTRWSTTLSSNVSSNPQPHTHTCQRQRDCERERGRERERRPSTNSCRGRGDGRPDVGDVRCPKTRSSQRQCDGGAGRARRPSRMGMHPPGTPPPLYLSMYLYIYIYIYIYMFLHI